MENKKRYLVISLIVLIGVVAIVGGVYAYGYYMNQKFGENFKLAYYNVIQSEKYYNDSVIDGNKTYHTQESFNAGKKIYLEDLNKTIDSQQKAVNYMQNMVNYAPTDVDKRYSEALLSLNKAFLQYYNLYYEQALLWNFKGYSNLTQAIELVKEMNSTSDNITNLAETKDKIKLENPDLNNQIENLTDEANKVIN